MRRLRCPQATLKATHKKPMTETVATGLHVAILLCAGIAAAYLGAMVVQLRRLKHKQRAVVTSACEPSIGQKISVEAELQRISLEISRLRSELGAARNEVRQLRSEHYAASVAPRYNEAMAFARRGFTAPGIATRCGISMGKPNWWPHWHATAKTLAWQCQTSNSPGQ